MALRRYDTFGKMDPRMPSVCCKEGERYIENICEDTVIGYKYFDFTPARRLFVQYRGEGSLTVKTDDKVLGKLILPKARQWSTVFLPIAVQGIHPLYLLYSGKSCCELKALGFT